MHIQMVCNNSFKLIGNVAKQFVTKYEKLKWKDTVQHENFTEFNL